MKTITQRLIEPGDTVYLATSPAPDLNRDGYDALSAWVEEGEQRPLKVVKFNGIVSNAGIYRINDVEAPLVQRIICEGENFERWVRFEIEVMGHRYFVREI